LKLSKNFSANPFGRKDFQKKTIRVFFWPHKSVGMQRFKAAFQRFSAAKRRFCHAEKPLVRAVFS